jgi:hypothetical protein
MDDDVEELGSNGKLSSGVWIDDEDDEWIEDNGDSEVGLGDNVSMVD